MAEGQPTNCIKIVEEKNATNWLVAATSSALAKKVKKRGGGSKIDCIIKQRKEHIFYTSKYMCVATDDHVFPFLTTVSSSFPTMYPEFPYVQHYLHFYRISKSQIILISVSNANQSTI